MPILQDTIIDMKTVGPFATINASFILSLLCFSFIAVYGYRTLKGHSD